MKNGLFILLLTLLTAPVFAAGSSDNGGTSSDHGFSCEKFGPDSIKAIQYYSLYREYFKQENYKAAMQYWPYVYKNAPMLNSRVISNGMEYYQMKVDETAGNPEAMKVYLDSLLLLIDHKTACTGDEVRNLARKGNLLLKYRPEAGEEIRNFYAESIELGGTEAPYYVLETYFRLLLNDLNQELIEPEQVLEMREKIELIVDANLNDEKYGPNYQQVLQNIESLFESNPKVQQLFDCEAMKPTWEEQYRTDPENVEFIKDVYRKMNTAKCKDDPFTEELKMALIKLDPTPDRMMLMAGQSVKDKDYNKAIDYIKKAITLEESAVKRAELNYKIAELYYVQKDFPTARSYARKASADRPNWGKPYLLIGKLYASSGKLCGPGTGLESQRVIWPALDYFQKAKSFDDASADEAQTLINRYSAYLPEKSEIFMQWGKGDGEAYFVPCWIQENTTIRTK